LKSVIRETHLQSIEAIHNKTPLLLTALTKWLQEMLQGLWGSHGAVCSYWWKLLWKRHFVDTIISLIKYSWKYLIIYYPCQVLFSTNSCEDNF
jgi:hypothetical protein